MSSTPSTPGTPHRRPSAGIRRPRVAGMTPAVTRPAPSGHEVVPGDDTRPEEVRPEEVRPGEVRPGAVALLKRESGEEETTEHPPVDPSDAAADPADPDTDREADEAPRPTGKLGLGGRTRRLRSVLRTRRRIPTLVLVGLLVVLTAAAVFFGIANAALRGTPAAQNIALVDVGASAQATQQLGDAAKTVYSYDFARLDQNEAAARALITPAFEAQYNQLFGQVRKIAPQQQAVVTATIVTSATRDIEGDKAVVVMFLDQQVTRAQAGGQPQQLAAAGRLTVTGQLVDGTWKIADVQAE